MKVNVYVVQKQLDCVYMERCVHVYISKGRIGGLGGRTDQMRKCLSERTKNSI